MKTKLRIVLASVLVAAGLAMTAGAASYDNCADQLKDLGLTIEDTAAGTRIKTL